MYTQSQVNEIELGERLTGKKTTLKAKILSQQI